MWQVVLIFVLVVAWIYYRSVLRGKRKDLHGRDLLKARFKERRVERLEGAETWEERRRRKAIWQPEVRIAPHLLEGLKEGGGEMRKRVAAFCSHGGSNFAAIADAAERGDVPIEVVVMVHNNAKAGAKAKAKARHIPTEWVPRKRFPDEDAYGRHLLELLERYRVDYIALAGFMQRIPPSVIRAYPNRITNIHPALLPAFGGPGFYGMKVHEAVFASGMKISGPTVHLVDDQYDHGPILLQWGVDISDCKEPAEIAERVLVEEHKLYPETLGLLAMECFHVEGRRATLVRDRVTMTG